MISTLGATSPSSQKQVSVCHFFGLHKWNLEIRVAHNLTGPASTFWVGTEETNTNMAIDSNNSLASIQSSLQHHMYKQDTRRFMKVSLWVRMVRPKCLDCTNVQQMWRSRSKCHELSWGCHVSVFTWVHFYAAALGLLVDVSCACIGNSLTYCSPHPERYRRCTSDMDGHGTIPVHLSSDRGKGGSKATVAPPRG